MGFRKYKLEILVIVVTTVFNVIQAMTGNANLYKIFKGIGMIGLQEL